MLFVVIRCEAVCAERELEACRHCAARRPRPPTATIMSNCQRSGEPAHARNLELSCIERVQGNISPVEVVYQSHELTRSMAAPEHAWHDNRTSSSSHRPLSISILDSSFNRLL